MELSYAYANNWKRMTLVSLSLGIFSHARNKTECRASRSSSQKIASLRLHVQVSVYMLPCLCDSFLLPLARIQLEKTGRRFNIFRARDVARKRS